MALGQVLRLTRSLLSPSDRGKVGWLATVMVVNALTELAGVAGIVPFLAVAADPAVAQRSSLLRALSTGLGHPGHSTLFAVLGLGFLGLFVTLSMLNTFTYWMCYRFSYQVGRHLSNRLMRNLMGRPYVWFLDRNTAELSKALLQDAEKVAECVVHPLGLMLSRLLVALFLCAGLLALNPGVALVTAGILCLIYRLIYGFFISRMAAVGLAHHQLGERRYRLADQAATSLREVKALGRRGHFLGLFEGQSQHLADLGLRYRLIQGMPRPLTEVLALVAIVSVLIYLTHHSAGAAAALPMVGVYVMATWRLVPALQSIYDDLAHIGFHVPVLEKLTALLAEQVPERDESVPPLRFRQSLQLEGVTYTYPQASAPSLRGVSIRIGKQTSVALVGRTGAGKTTVADVVAGLLLPQEGQVRLDGQPLLTDQIPAWQANIGYVPQEIYLLDDSIRRNIAFGVDDLHIDEEAVVRAAQIARIHGFILSRPQGYHTMLGERGVNLSGGERQRIGIARALYHDPELLILDEATSSLDHQTEQAVMEALADLAHTKTVLIIAHRLTTVQACQSVYFLDHGQVLAHGTYQELLETSPSFQELVSTLTVLKGPGPLALEYA